MRVWQRGAADDQRTPVGAETSPWALRGRANNIDFIRLVLATLVVYAHSYPLLLREDAYANEVFRRITRGQADGGMLAVCGFFLLSGYLITQSWERSPSLARYLWKRLLRIYPAFLVATVLSVFVAGTLGSASPTGYLSGLSPRILLLDILTLSLPRTGATFMANPFPGFVNGSLWTIQSEFVCYLLVGLVGIGGVGRRPAVATGFAAGFFTIAIISPAMTKYASLLAYFFIGSVLYLHRNNVPRSPRLFVASMTLIGVGIGTGTLRYVLPIAGSYPLLYVAFSPSGLNGLAKHGDFSYGMYLYAFPVQQLLVLYFERYLTPVGLFLCATLITTGFAGLSWFLVEAPSLRLKSWTPSWVRGAVGVASEPL